MLPSFIFFKNTTNFRERIIHFDQRYAFSRGGEAYKR